MMTIALVQKLLFFAAVIFMGIGFYTALAGGYASDYGAEDDSPEQKNKITICTITLTLSVICLIASLSLLVYRFVILFASSS
ncbi:MULTISPECIES: hypothetical protein [unclassified Acinetobacter]|uniref:hypothetical protein n=1 Tax=unclassified Acinetobacter TaxID=196816 RepID=UPI0015D30C77|nr:MULTISPECIES: hypothetical protein [unclassified Acinetobacter]